MKHFNHSYLAILPLLSILAVAPKEVHAKYPQSRSLASVVQSKSEHPKYDSLASKVDTSAVEEISLEDFKGKKDIIQDKIVTARLRYHRDETDKKILEEKRREVESLATELALVDHNLKQLKTSKKIESSDEESSSKELTESKNLIDDLLSDPEEGEKIVVKEEIKKEAPKKEEAKKKDVKTEEKNEVADSAKKEDCGEEKMKVLSKSVELLMQQQTQIMQSLLAMNQSMMAMIQSQQVQQRDFYQFAMQTKLEEPSYNYNSQFSSGNWVYHPQGFRPQQQNIFAQPQGSLLTSGFYPDQVFLPRPQGMQQPLSFSQDPAFQPQPQPFPGNFGPTLSFNMNNSPVFPGISLNMAR